MKKSLLLLLLCTGLLTGCGNQDMPAEPTETSTVSQTTTEQTAEPQTTTTTVGIPEVTETCSDVIPSVTTTTETSVNTEEAPKDTESTTTTTAQEDSPAVTEADTEETVETSRVTTTTKATATTKVTTTKKPVTTTKVTTTKKPTTTTKATTTTKVTTTTTTVTTPSGPVITDDNLYGYYFDISDRMNDSTLDWTKVTLQVGLFIDQYPTRYHELNEKGATFTGTEQEKAEAILNYAYSLGGRNCIDYALNAYFLYQGAGLQTGLTFESNNGWYGHVANVVKVNGKWMSFDASACKCSESLYMVVKAFDIYENTITL
ncbi:MAG: hypothetical protein IKL00_03890 [Oscillospiraceae bacterium]|nr:hypothetical protein [Oscillospiraceae bacterium]